MKDISLRMNDYLPLRDVVFNTLREAILNGEIEPGERLMEIKLSETLGVSRTPIREAIRMLQIEGLVNMTPRKGTVVADISKEDLKSVLEVRRALEELAVTLACKNMVEADIAELKSNLTAFTNAVEKEIPSDIAKIDEAFHDIIYKSTKNERLIQLLYNLREQMFRYRLEYIKDYDTRQTVIKDHEKLIYFIENKDIDSAKQTIVSHIDDQERTIVKNMGFKYDDN